ncbi:MAG: GNAT family N-acetyltransferase [Candidatus Hodarchaeota archaeon]
MSERSPQICSMKGRNWPAFHRLDEEIFPDDMVSQEYFMKRVEQEGFFALKTSSGQIVGQLILGRFGEDKGRLNRIGVAKSLQQRGLGTKLMNFAFKWFQEQQTITKVILYTQQDNIAAQRLYRRFDFKTTGTTRHYVVPLKSLNPLGRYKCQRIRSEEIEEAGEQFRQALPAAEIRRSLESQQLVLTLKDQSSRIVGICGFSPSFPGCFPFEIKYTESFDDFVYGLQRYALPEFDYIRVTFTDNAELAQLCGNRDYRLHHKLFKMEAAVTNLESKHRKKGEESGQES